MPGYVLAGLFIMALIAPTATAFLVVATCHRSPRRMWIVGAVAEFITIGLSVGVIGYTHIVGWWSGGWAMVGFVLICILTIFVNGHGFSGASDLVQHLDDSRAENSEKLRRVS